MYRRYISFKLKSARTKAALSTSPYVSLCHSGIDTFPDPVPHEADGALRHEPGADTDEKFLPAAMEKAEKGPNDIPFDRSV